MLEALSDYPLLDDQMHWEVEQEMINEHWDSYGRDDLFDVIAENLGGYGRTDLTQAAEDMLTELVWSDVIDVYPTVIDASAVDFGEREIAEWVAARIGRIVTIPSRHRASVTFDLRINKLLEV